MDNENKNLQENELTPEERVQEDISNKIADAAAEIQDEILEASGEEVTPAEAEETDDVPAETDESWNDEAWEEAEPVKEAEPIIIKKSKFVISLIAAALIGAIITVCCFKAPVWIASIPEGTKVASVGDTKITDLDMRYYIFMEIYNYAQENQIAQDELSDIDWDEEINGVKLSDKIKSDAIDSALKEAALIEKGTENGVALEESDILGMESQVNSFIAQYGKEGFETQLRTSGIADIKQYTKLLKSNILLSAVRDDIGENPDNYYPEDESVLADYVSDDEVSVKHILIKVEDEAADEEKRALAQSILDRVNAGEDFDALMSEFNEDEGEPEEGYTFGKGEMVAEFEEASFALQVDQVSELVKTEFGYHIIKRVAPKVGTNELYNYIKAQAEDDIKVNEKKIAKISVADVVADVVAALEEAEAQEAAK